jgi:hypothetical protein
MMNGSRIRMWTAVLAACAGTVISPSVMAQPQAGGGAESGEKKPDFPKFQDVAKDFEKVVSTADGKDSLYTLWIREKDGQMLAELPRGYQNQRHFIALTVGSGEPYAGLQAGDMYVYWKRFDKRLALIAPQLNTRSSGDPEIKSGVERLWTDRVILDIPIVCIGPNGQPVIDLDQLLVGNATKFFGSSAAGANQALATIAKAKAFPENIEVAVEMPTAGGRLKTFHYSISLLKGDPSYKPRLADERVGYFTTTYRDLGKFRDDEKWVRYINRWHLEKRDPKLRMSPPKEPIVYYVDHTVPVRYRRYVKQGIDYWNKAFEQVGIVGAIEVRFQDKETGAYMDLDPEDVRYNFIRWLSNDIGTAVGPSRVNPNTGQILDADVVLTDGWIRHFWFTMNELNPNVLMDGFTPETLAWLDKHPNWDPRVRLAPPGERDFILAQRAKRGVLRYGGHPAAQPARELIGTQEYDGLKGLSQTSGLCMAAQGKAYDMALMGMHMEILGMLEELNEPQAGGKAAPAAQESDKADKKDDSKKDEPKKQAEDLLDGIPEWFVGTALADLVAHEVGHTLGLRHNFKASGAYTLAQINSEAFKGRKPFTASVMDYNPVNINMGDGAIQGDWNMIDIGPYDMWAIEYGYTFGDPKEVAKRASEPELQFGTDEDTWGPDPLCRRYDFSAEPLDFANSRMKLVRNLREKIVDRFVKDGQSWSRARRGYLISLSTQSQMLGMMSGWIGGAHVYRDKKGDPNGRPPIEVVPAARQRAALKFIIENSFYDEAFGLTPELLRHMTVDKWWDDGGMNTLFEDPTWPVHDRISGIQASVLTMIMNPTTLRRVYDNEFRVPADQDMLTLPEVMDTIVSAAWKELDNKPGATYSPRQPMISSLRRNLQSELVDRLIDLTLPTADLGAASKPVANLSVAKLKEIRGKIKRLLESDAKARIDAYTLAHFDEIASKIDRALDAQFIYNTDDIALGAFGGFLFGQTPAPVVMPSPATPEDFMEQH